MISVNFFSVLILKRYGIIKEGGGEEQPMVKHIAMDNIEK
jgi:hypothetical protein